MIIYTNKVATFTDKKGRKHVELFYFFVINVLTFAV